MVVRQRGKGSRVEPRGIAEHQQARRNLVGFGHDGLDQLGDGGVISIEPVAVGVHAEDLGEPPGARILVGPIELAITGHTAVRVVVERYGAFRRVGTAGPEEAFVAVPQGANHIVRETCRRSRGRTVPASARIVRAAAALVEAAAGLSRLVRQ